MLERHLRSCARARTHRELYRLAALEGRCNVGCDAALTALLDRAEHLREQPRRLLGAVLVDQKTPPRRERLVECSQKLVGDLAQRLRLVRELADVVAVVDGAPAARLTWGHG